MKKLIFVMALAGGILACCTQKKDNQNENTMKKLEMTQEWDKVFPKSDKVNHRKVTFMTQYGLTLAADMYTPKDVADEHAKLAAIAVSGPFGATKEQSSGLYAMRMAERGLQPASALRVLSAR